MGNPWPLDESTYGKIVAAVFQLLGSPGWFTVGYVEPQTPKRTTKKSNGGVICKVSLGLKEKLHLQRGISVPYYYVRFHVEHSLALKVRFHDTCLRFEHGR